MIPAEAVEAAARGILGADEEVWRIQPDATKDRYRLFARRALEAASPYMLAGTMRAVAAEIGGDPATAVTDPAVHRLLKMLLDRADKMEPTGV